MAQQVAKGGESQITNHYAAMKDKRDADKGDAESSRFVQMSDRADSEDETEHDMNLHMKLVKAQELNHWRGQALYKSAFCMQQYTLLLQELKPRTVIETGTAMGGSAVWFADLCQVIVGADFDKVIATDLSLKNVSQLSRQHNKITWVEMPNSNFGSYFLEDGGKNLQELKHPILIIEDAHFDCEHVLSFAHEHMLQPGDYMIVEDTHLLHPATLEHLKLHNDEENAALRRKKKIIRELCLEHPELYRVDTLYQDMFGLNVGKAADSFIKRVN